MEDVREHLQRLLARLDGGTLTDRDARLVRQMAEHDPELRAEANMTPAEKAAAIIARKFPRLVEPERGQGEQAAS